MFSVFLTCLIDLNLFFSVEWVSFSKYNKFWFDYKPIDFRPNNPILKIADIYLCTCSSNVDFPLCIIEGLYSILIKFSVIFLIYERWTRWKPIQIHSLYFFPNQIFYKTCIVKCTFDKHFEQFAEERVF